MTELMSLVGVREGRRKVVDITRKVGTAETLSESVIHCALTEKDCYLYYLVKTHRGRTVVFCNSIDCVRRLGNLFSLLDVHPLPLHAQMHQRQRLKNLDRFTASSSGLLIATDVAARGLDIPNIEHVVHYQVPRTSESYVHRSGRTARAAKQGLSVLLVEPKEQMMFRKLCLTLARGDNAAETIPSFPVDGSRLSAVKRTLGAARKLDKMLLQARKKSVSDSWKAEAARDADLILSSGDDSEEEFYQRKQANAKGLEPNKANISAARAALQQFLQQPLQNSGYGGSYPTMGGLGRPMGQEEVEVKAVDVLENNKKQTHELLKGPKKSKKTFKKKKKIKKE